MKKLLSALLILALTLALLSATAFAAGNPELSKYSDAEIKQMYEAFRDEMVARGMPLAAQITLKEGKFIVGEDILPGSYTIKCTETFGDTYGDLYSSLGGMFNDELGGLMGSLGGMMSDIVNAQVVILGELRLGHQILRAQRRRIHPNHPDGRDRPPDHGRQLPAHLGLRCTPVLRAARLSGRGRK